MELYSKAKAGFVLQGTTFNAWCRRHSIIRQNAKQALTGSWNGPKARALRDQILRAAKVVAE